MGSDKLNISFNPSQESELATYNYDDDATVASKRLSKMVYCKEQ